MPLPLLTVGGEFPYDGDLMRTPGAGEQFIDGKVIAVADAELVDLITYEKTYCVSPEFIADNREPTVPDPEYQGILIPVHTSIELHNFILVPEQAGEGEGLIDGLKKPAAPDYLVSSKHAEFHCQP